jgi:hypothetical protein
MKKGMTVATALIAVSMMTGGFMTLAAQGPSAGVDKTTMAAVQDWQKAPAGMNAAGYADGIQALQLDKLTGRAIDFRLGNRYQHPLVKKEQRDAYRAAFEAGYKAAMQHSS